MISEGKMLYAQQGFTFVSHFQKQLKTRKLRNKFECIYKKYWISWLLFQKIADVSKGWCVQKSSFQEYKLWYKPDPTINRHEQSTTLRDFLYHVVLHAANSKSLNWLYVPHSNDMDSKFVKQHVHVNHSSWFLMTGYRNLATNGKQDKMLTPCV